MDESAIEPRLTPEAARGLAAGLLQRPGVPPATLLGMVQLCRRSGALAEARGLLDRLLASDAPPAPAVALATAFGGRRPERSATGATPSPFIRELEVFEPQAHAALLAELTARLPHFEAAKVEGVATGGAYGLAKREARVIYDIGPLRELFLKRLKRLLKDEVYDAFGVDPGSVHGVEVQGAYHGDGAFFSPHRDSSATTSTRREISCVYYLHALPKAFQGGDLILFDDRAEPNTYFRDGYTRIPPDDNSLVFFPSTAAHEVQPVSLPAEAPTQGRLTINGWIWVRC